MTGWQQIDANTPRETFVLVFGPEGVDVAEYLNFLGAWYRRDGVVPRRETKLATPTHWMPLPDPPEAA